MHHDRQDLGINDQQDPQRLCTTAIVIHTCVTQGHNKAHKHEHGTEPSDPLSLLGIVLYDSELRNTGHDGWCVCQLRHQEVHQVPRFGA